MSATFMLSDNIALLTKHAKQDIISPIFEREFGARIVKTDAFDTDSLGTFDNAVPRQKSPRQAALKKAYLACELTGCSQGLGSEGSFNSMMGLGVVDDEILAFVDIEQKIEVVASASQLIPLDAIEATDANDLVQKLAPFYSATFIAKYGDNQRWLLRGNDNDKWLKGLSASELKKAVKTWPAYIEPDFRAMYCPPRRTVIALATKNLVYRLQNSCPHCNAIDFVAKHDPQNLKYLPCEICSLPTTKLAPPPRCCEKCGFRSEAEESHISNTAQTASAMHCNFCNP